MKKTFALGVIVVGEERSLNLYTIDFIFPIGVGLLQLLAL